MALSEKQLKIQEQMLNPFKFGLFKIFKLPIAYLAGIKLRELNEKTSTSSVRYKYLNTNPFKSMYFAILAMAAELSTGSLALFSIAKHDESIAVLVVSSKGTFMKKAVGEIRFECNNGLDFKNKLEELVQTKEAGLVIAKAIGYNSNDEIVCEYEFTWSFKVRS
jgi:hypothetical protein